VVDGSPNGKLEKSPAEGRWLWGRICHRDAHDRLHVLVVKSPSENKALGRNEGVNHFV
jgi:hypothetical protein